MNIQAQSEVENVQNEMTNWGIKFEYKPLEKNSMKDDLEPNVRPAETKFQEIKESDAGQGAEGGFFFFLHFFFQFFY